MKNVKQNLAALIAPLGLGIAAMGMVTLTGCGSEPATQTQQKQLINDSAAVLKDMELADSSLTAKVNAAAGYVVFPNVGKGAIGVEVASGNGDVYQGGKYIGTAHLGMVGAGLALGASNYAELILFQTPEALADFENNRIKFDASTSAVALQAGAATTADYKNGVMVFLRPHGGLIAEAAVGGQQFTFKAANPQPATQP